MRRIKCFLDRDSWEDLRADPLQHTTTKDDCESKFITCGVSPHEALVLLLKKVHQEFVTSFDLQAKLGGKKLLVTVTVPGRTCICCRGATNQRIYSIF